jgi:hypothetical protein
MSMTFPVAVNKKKDNWTLLDCEIAPYRTILAFPSSKVPNILTGIESLVTDQ